MNPHVHISGLEALKIMLVVVVGLGTIHVVARRYEGHPLADAALNFLC